MEAAHLIHILQGPFDQAHILLIGHSNPVPFLVLSAQCCGYTLVHMSDVFSTKLLAKNSTNLDGMSAKSYRSPQFKEDLKTLFLRAGVKVIVMCCACLLCVQLFLCTVQYVTMCACHQYHTICTIIICPYIFFLHLIVKGTLHILELYSPW